MRKRRSRKNAFWGFPRLHSKAARKGWARKRSRRSRRTRHNAGAMSLVHNTTRSLKAGFAPNTLKRATAILLGNISTTFYVDQIGSRVPMIRSNPVFEIGSLLLLAGANAMVAKRIWPKHASDILIGGILAGVTRAVKTVLPGRFSTCGLGEDMEGMGGMDGWFADPRQIQHAFPLAGYASPAAPTIGTHGLGDEAMYHQVQPTNVIQLDGLANEEVGREIAMQM